MFRHKETTTDEAKKPEPVVAEAVKTAPGLKELIEKNLKWSQIIYEQNRKINNKLLWSAVANWLRLMVIVVPIVLAILFLGPMLKNIWSQYSDLLGGVTAVDKGMPQQGSLESLFKLFNLDPAKQEQLKALLK